MSNFPLLGKWWQEPWGEFCLRYRSKNFFTQFFWLTSAFSNLNTINLNIFPNIFRDKERERQRDRERQNRKESIKIEDVSLRIILNTYSGNRHNVYLPFCWPWSRWVEVFFKKEGNKIGSINFEKGIETPLQACTGGWRQFHERLSACCFFSYKERITVKAIFHIDLPGYASEPRQRYKIRLLLVYLELGVREGEGVWKTDRLITDWLLRHFIFSPTWILQLLNPNDVPIP